MRTGKVVIPARMNSSRLPGKLMIHVKGMPIIEHVWRRARLVIPESDIVVTTDSDIIASHMERKGAKIHRSKTFHTSGTSRTREFMNSERDLEFSVILQGDEVLVRPLDLKELFNYMSMNYEFDFVNTVSSLSNLEELNDFSVVKCTVDSLKQIRFMFRGNPFRDSIEGAKQIFTLNGLFALSRRAFGLFEFNPMGLAHSESIEQLGYLDLGERILALETAEHLTSVNTDKDLVKVNSLLSSSPEQQAILHQYL